MLLVTPGLRPKNQSKLRAECIGLASANDLGFTDAETQVLRGWFVLSDGPCTHLGDRVSMADSWFRVAANHLLNQRERVSA